MNTYQVYKINDSLEEMFDQYPNIKRKILSLEPKNPFFTYQIETLFDNNDAINEYIYNHLKQRSDYQKEKNTHIINNQLTKERITCKVNNYSIEIVAPKKSNIFYDILYQYSKRYVIMDGQSMK